MDIEGIFLKKKLLFLSSSFTCMLFIAEVKKEWSCASTHPYIFIAWYVCQI